MKTNRLTALDKCTGVRPIVIGEVLRRIIGRSLVKCVERDLQLLRGNVQMCPGQKNGVEHAIHALQRRFFEDRTEGILLIDARNAFNSLNRDLALKHIRKLCHSIYTAIRNSYKTPSVLFIDKRVMMSQEGTTQSDPIAMSMYGVATLPLIDMLEDQILTYKWYADDSNVTGSLESLRKVLDKLYEHGLAFGYNLIKCHLIKNLSWFRRRTNFFGIRCWCYGRSSSSRFSYCFWWKLLQFSEKKVRELL